ncbi:MAG: hypothetical protein JO195_01335 [Candidatus Eremiobacteraeota bacterium]|nr:hypothetical protein [Candidatus Eremiobacteraeota bacterium]
MNISRTAVLFAAVILALSAAGCGGGSSVSTQPQVATQHPSSPQAPALQAQALTLSPSGGTFALKLPAGYSGSLTIGPNHAPPGTVMEVGIASALMAQHSGETRYAKSPPPDPFPLVFTIKLPITITLPILGFTITFPSWVNLAQGTFDVSFFDPTQPIGFVAPTNPTLIGKATASGHTLTFVPAVQFFTFKAHVAYSETIARDTGGAGVVLPVSAGANNQQLPPNGTLGSPNVAETSSASTFLQWTVIPFGPTITVGGDGTPASGPESLIVQSTGTTSLTGTKVTLNFNPGGPAPTPGGPGTFTPDTNPTVLGPYDATCTNNLNCTFTVTDAVTLSAGHKFAIELLSVDVCVPSDVSQPCDATNPDNALTLLNGNQQYDVLVSDATGLLTGPNYSVAVTGSNPDGSPLPEGATPCTFVSEAEGNGDNPPGYNDTWPIGPNTEFEVNTGSPPIGGAACTFVVSYNGNPVASTNIAIGGSAPLTVAMKKRLMHRLFVNPPVKGRKGVLVSGG